VLRWWACEHPGSPTEESVTEAIQSGAGVEIRR
jgi:hypothetical protein